MLLFFGGFSAIILAVEYAASVRLHMTACVAAIVASAFVVLNTVFTGCIVILAYAGFFEMRTAADDWKFMLGMLLLAYYGSVTGLCHGALAQRILRLARSAR